MRAFLLITIATVLHSCLAAQPEVFGYSQASIRAAKAKLTAHSGVVTPLHEGNGTGKLYLFNNSVVVPGSPALLEFDLSTKKYSVCTIRVLGCDVFDDTRVPAYMLS